MAVRVREKLTTVDDLWELSHQGDEQRRYLIEGVLYETPRASEEHGVAAGEIAFYVLRFVREHKLGRVTAAETGYVLYQNPEGKDTVLAPDVGFISRERMTEQPSKKYVPMAPDLAVEVVSPNDTYNEVAQKVAVYLRFDTRMVWVFDPASKTVAVHTAAGARLLDVDATLDGGAVLPGFQLPLRELFVGQ